MPFFACSGSDFIEVFAGVLCVQSAPVHADVCPVYGCSAKKGPKFLVFVRGSVGAGSCRTGAVPQALLPSSFTVPQRFCTV